MMRPAPIRYPENIFELSWRSSAGRVVQISPLKCCVILNCSYRELMFESIAKRGSLSYSIEWFLCLLQQHVECLIKTQMIIGTGHSNISVHVYNCSTAHNCNKETVKKYLGLQHCWRTRPTSERINKEEKLKTF